MAAGFKCGTSEISIGATEVTLTGLALGFVPTAVQVSVRQPSSNADILTAYVAGVPTADGFTALLSSAPVAVGYRLDWVALKDGVTPTPEASDTLQVSYGDLKREVARFLGYDPTSLSALQVSEVDSYIQGGLRQFYYPPAMEGVDIGYEWSFLRQNGSVNVSSGVSEYLLPDGFGRIAGQLNFSDAQASQTVPIIPYGDIRAMISRNPGRTGRPRFAATLAQSSFGSRGQRKKLYLFPTPDASYTLNFVCDADTGKLDSEDRVFPLGGPMFSELVTESCLAIAEQKANDEMGAHTAKFQQLLVGMISRDRKSGAQQYGFVGDPDGWRW